MTRYTIAHRRSRSRIDIRSLAIASQPATAMQSVDTLIEARWVIPVEPEGVVLEHHAVVIDDGRIGAILPQAQARSGYTASRTVALPGHVVLPGLVNAHTHAGMTLLRGFADDPPLMRWLEEHVWPAGRTRHRHRRNRGRPPAERRRFPPTPRTRPSCRDSAVFCRLSIRS